MREIKNIGLKDVQEVYMGAEGELWTLIMGEQIHIGGFQSSMNLAAKAQICSGMRGVDFCCALGAGMRFLVKCCGVGKMTGVDATDRMLELGRKKTEEQGLGGCIEFVKGDVSASSLPSSSADFIWGEDAWCYVESKAKLIAEAARIVKKGGVIAFTDWLEGKTPMTDLESERFLKFMKFPNILSLKDYSKLLEFNDFNIKHAEHTGLFAPYVDLYIDIINKQLTFDALRILNYDKGVLQYLAGEMAFMQNLAHDGKIEQGLFVAVKR